MTTVTFKYLDQYDGNPKDANYLTILSTNTGLPPFTVTFTNPIQPGSTFTYTDGNHASDTGTYIGTNSQGDLFFHVGQSYFVLTNHVYTIGDRVTIVPNNFVCFLRGALIETPDGERRIEDLKIGDRIATVSGAAKTIVWIGSGRARLQPWSVKPVVVRAGALEGGAPKRDLRLTEGHCLLIDGVLVPVGTLVNGRSIVWDDEAVEVEYFHLEVAGHDVAIADGAPAETYRNDGNRRYFLAGEVGSEERLTEPNELAPYAPIVSHGDEHGRIWRKVSERAGRAPTTTDADLHLLADGERVEPESTAENRYVFTLRGRPQEIRIASRAFQPCAVGLGPDWRTLGVAVRALTLRGQGVTVTIAHDAPILTDRMARGRTDVSLDSGLRGHTADCAGRRRSDDRGRSRADRRLPAFDRARGRGPAVEGRSGGLRRSSQGAMRPRVRQSDVGGPERPTRGRPAGLTAPSGQSPARRSRSPARRRRARDGSRST